MPHPSLTLVMPTISWEEPFGICICIRAALAGLKPWWCSTAPPFGAGLAAQQPCPPAEHRPALGPRPRPKSGGPAGLWGDPAVCGSDVELHPDAMERILAIGNHRMGVPARWRPCSGSTCCSSATPSAMEEVLIEVP